MRPTEAAKAIVAAGLLCALLQMPAEAQVQQLVGLATKAVPMLIMQGVKEYKKATDPAYAKAEKERPKGKDADDEFLDGDNFSSEWKQLRKQNSHIRLQDAADGDAASAAQANKGKAARKNASEDSADGAKDNSESDIKKVSVQAAKPAIAAPPRDNKEGSDWFLDEDDASSRKISAKVSKQKPAEQDEAPESAANSHTESVQGKLLKSSAAEAASAKATVSAVAKNKNAETEQNEASRPESESSPVIMMPVAK